MLNSVLPSMESYESLPLEKQGLLPECSVPPEHDSTSSGVLEKNEAQFLKRRLFSTN